MDGSLRPIAEIASQLDISEVHLQPHGRFTAKLKLGLLDESASRPGARRESLRRTYRRLAR